MLGGFFVADTSELREAEKVRASQEKALKALQDYTLSHYPESPAKFGELLLRIPELQRTCNVSCIFTNYAKKLGISLVFFKFFCLRNVQMSDLYDLVKGEQRDADKQVKGRRGSKFQPADGTPTRGPLKTRALLASGGGYYLSQTVFCLLLHFLALSGTLTYLVQRAGHFFFKESSFFTPASRRARIKFSHRGKPLLLLGGPFVNIFYTISFYFEVFSVCRCVLVSHSMEFM